LGRWLAIGIGIGTAIGVACKNIPVGVGAPYDAYSRTKRIIPGLI
jgi:hypothetical protein